MKLLSVLFVLLSVVSQSCGSFGMSTLKGIEPDYGTGIAVYRGMNPFYSMYVESNYPVKFTLFHRNDRIKVSKEEVLEFIKEDPTDTIPYVIHYRECGFYAREIYNKASERGYKVGFMSCCYSSNDVHTFNVFDTSDAGYLFIDCTNGLGWEKETTWKEGDSSDKEVDSPDIGRPLRFIPISGHAHFGVSAPVNVIEIYW